MSFLDFRSCAPCPRWRPLLKTPARHESLIPSVIRLAVRLVATKPGKPFRDESWPSLPRREQLVTGGLLSAFPGVVPKDQGVHCPAGQRSTDSRRYRHPDKGGLAPVYRCCPQKTAQYSMMSETTVQGLRGGIDGDEVC